MAYRVVNDVYLRSSETGLTLTPALKNDDDTAAAGLVTVRIVEKAVAGVSIVYHAVHDVPDGHVGWIDYSVAGVLKSSVGVNPSEAVNAYQRNLIADHVLCRDWNVVTLVAAARCAWQALRPLRNAVTPTASGFSVKTENDLTEAWNATVTKDPNAVPVTGYDPS